MPPEIISKIATEKDVNDLDSLRQWLKDKDHPIVKTWKEKTEQPKAEAAPSQPAPQFSPQFVAQQVPTTGFTIPSLELPAGAIPIQGAPQGISFKIILKNARIKAERVIIRVEKGG
jgi:acetyl-CoA decarbonylase/synthase complex subunit beta